MTPDQFERLRRYLDDDAQGHIRAHGKWWLDGGKLRAALEHAGVTMDGDTPSVRDALSGLVDCVHCTGGVKKDGPFAAPVADPEWIDLGRAYLVGCRALGLTPKWADRYLRVEYDPAYSGGNYDGVGEFALISVQMVDDLGAEAAFARVTGLDPVTIIHWSEDEQYDADGNLVSD